MGQACHRPVHAQGLGRPVEAAEPQPAPGCASSWRSLVLGVTVPGGPSALDRGLRRGEALGLKWTDVDLVVGSLVVSRSRVRLRHEHGCSGDCGKEYTGHCLSRKLSRSATAETKPRAGRHALGLPAELITFLKEH